jgi:hypothetical protein
MQQVRSRSKGVTKNDQATRVEGQPKEDSKKTALDVKPSTNSTYTQCHPNGARPKELNITHLDGKLHMFVHLAIACTTTLSPSIVSHGTRRLKQTLESQFLLFVVCIEPFSRLFLKFAAVLAVTPSLTTVAACPRAAYSLRVVSNERLIHR